MAHKPHTMESIMALVEPVTESGCWIFHGHLTEHGYARVVFNGKSVRVHRLIYEHFVGPIQSGLVPDHLCRVRCCVNPYHLEPVKNKANVLRGVGVTARNALKTHCPQGHELTTPKWTRSKEPQRVCVTCRKAQQSKWKQCRRQGGAQ